MEFELDKSWLRERVEPGIPDSFKVQTLIKSFNKDLFLFNSDLWKFWDLLSVANISWEKIHFQHFSLWQRREAAINCTRDAQLCSGGAEWQALLCQLRLKQYPGSCHLWFLWRSKCQTIPVCLGGDVPLFNQTLGRRDKETDPLGWVGHLPAKWDICAPAPFKCFMAKQLKSYSSPPSVGCSCCSWPQHRILLRTSRQGYLVWFQSSREDPGSHSKTYYLYR